MEPFISKHDPHAYDGKMDRLTFSRQLNALRESVYDLVQETVDEQSMELVNLQIVARNEALSRVAVEIEDMARRLLQTDRSTLADFWNTAPEEQKEQL